MGLDSSGARYTVISRDVDGASGVLALWHDGVMADWEPGSSTVAATRGGWPFWHVLGGLAGFPEPHDPDTDAHGLILRPPQGPEKVAASRRGLADSLADELATSGHQDAEVYRQDRLMVEYNFGETAPEPILPRAIDLCPPGSAYQTQPQALSAIDRALHAARELTTAGPAAPGRLRIRRGSARARVIKALGDDWALVARTDGPAVLLLDVLAGPLDVTVHPLLAGLVDALEAAERAASS